MSLIKTAHRLITAFNRWKLIAAIGRPETMEPHARLYVSWARFGLEEDVHAAELRASAILAKRAQAFDLEWRKTPMAEALKLDQPERAFVTTAEGILARMKRYRRREARLDTGSARAFSLYAPDYLDKRRYLRAIMAGIGALNAATPGGVAVRWVYLTDTCEPWSLWKDRCKLAFEAKGTLEVVPATDAYALLSPAQRIEDAKAVEGHS